MTDTNAMREAARERLSSLARDMMRAPNRPNGGGPLGFYIRAEEQVEVAQAVETVLALLATDRAAEVGEGWVYLNEDTGEEYARNHPVESGEVPDATRIRQSTAQEDHLWNEWQRAAASSPAPMPKVDAKMLGEVMQDAWGEICDDTGCHPLDIRREGKKLFFDERHWVDLISMRLNERLARDAKQAAPADASGEVRRLKTVVDDHFANAKRLARRCIDAEAEVKRLSQALARIADGNNTAAGIAARAALNPTAGAK